MMEAVPIPAAADVKSTVDDSCRFTNIVKEVEDLQQGSGTKQHTK